MRYLQSVATEKEKEKGEYNEMSKKYEYYDIKHLLKKYPNAHYYLAFGERSSGKTISSLLYALEENVKTGAQFAYIRRFGEDVKKSKMTELFAWIVESGKFAKIYKNEYIGITFQGGKFFPYTLDEKDKPVITEIPIGYAFDLNSMEHYKSISFPNINTIIFDEFLSRKGYLVNEFILFTNTISTIVRQRDDIKILMLGNTVNKYCPYFAEMGLSHVKNQQQGTIDVYKYGASGLEVVVEYCKQSEVGKKSDVYFAFDNPELQMITKGAWEIAIYPHMDTKYKPKDIIAQFFIDFDKEILHGELIATGQCKPFIFLHPKTTPIKDEDKDIIYGQEPSTKRNIMVGIHNQKDNLSRYINRCIAENRIFYATNETGEIFRNYIMWFNNYSIRNM